MDTPYSAHQATPGKPRLLDQVREKIRVKHYSPKTEDGVWEQTASWMTKLACEHPELLSEWQSLAAHKSATVRFRVACCLNDMPHGVATQVGHQLLTDRGSKVREMTAVRLEESAGNAYGLNRAASALRLDYYTLKRRVESTNSSARSATPAFVELSPPGAIPRECVIEFEDHSGATMRVHLQDCEVPDLVALGRSFWSGE